MKSTGFDFISLIKEDRKRHLMRLKERKNKNLDYFNGTHNTRWSAKISSERRE
jgi:hypothetical protein